LQKRYKALQLLGRCFKLCDLRLISARLLKASSIEIFASLKVTVLKIA
jgi:hypothetical protein